MSRDPPGRPAGRPHDGIDAPGAPRTGGGSHGSAGGPPGGSADAPARAPASGGPAPLGPGREYVRRAIRGGSTDAPTVGTGTTVVGVRADRAVVLAADRRASLGGRFVANKDVRKVEEVHPTAAVGLSGGVGPIQAFARGLRAEANLYEARRGEPLTADALATLAGNLIRGVPAQVVLGGVTPAGRAVGSGRDDGPTDGPARTAEDPVPRLYELDGGGSVLEAEYAAAGSGMQVAYGTLEDAHRGDLDRGGARRLAAEAVASASERDTASGNGITLATVDAEGVETEVVDGPEGLDLDGDRRGDPAGRDDPGEDGEVT